MHGAEEEKRRERAKTGRINEEGGKHQVEGVAAAVVATGEVRDRFLGGRSPLRLSPRLGGPPSKRVGASKEKDGQIASEVPAECRLHGRLSKSLVVVFPPVLGMHFTRAPLHDNEVATWSVK